MNASRWRGDATTGPACGALRPPRSKRRPHPRASPPFVAKAILIHKDFMSTCQGGTHRVPRQNRCQGVAFDSGDGEDSSRREGGFPVERPACPSLRLCPEKTRARRPVPLGTRPPGGGDPPISRIQSHTSPCHAGVIRGRAGGSGDDSRAPIDTHAPGAIPLVLHGLARSRDEVDGREAQSALMDGIPRIDGEAQGAIRRRRALRPRLLGEQVAKQADHHFLILGQASSSSTSRRRRRIASSSIKSSAPSCSAPPP